MNSSHENGLYLYAIVPTGEHVLFDVAGVDGGKGDVFTVPCHTGSAAQPLAAVVSASALPDYRGLSRPEAATYLIAHQKVVETVMRGFPALPVKFGTVLAGESQVIQLLNQGEAKFNSALEQYGNRVQMEVIVLWNLEYVFQQIALDETVQKAKQELVNCPLEELMAKRVAVGKQVQSLLEARRNTLRAEILPALQTISQEMTVNPLMDDTMVLNSALLLDEQGVRTLDKTLDKLDASFENRGFVGSASLVFRRVGPLPPYSFTTFEIQQLSFETIDDARQLLKLEVETNAKDIQRAYHREVVQLHPDLHPDLTEVEARMTKLSQAYRLLTNYAESLPHTDPAVCSLSRDAISQAMLITVQRPDLLP